MVTPRRPTPRKLPRSPAGVAIRDAILDASERMLAEGGVSRISTNLVAAKAGVSVGSLYQYFPGKDAILAALTQRLEHRAATQLEVVLGDAVSDDLEIVIGRVVDVLLHRLGDHAARHELRREVPTAWADTDSMRVDATVRELVAGALANRTDIRPGPLDVMTFVVAHAVEMVVESAVVTAPKMLVSPAFRGELIQLALRYLKA